MLLGITECKSYQMIRLQCGKICYLAIALYKGSLKFELIYTFRHIRGTQRSAGSVLWIVLLWMWFFGLLCNPYTQFRASLRILSRLLCYHIYQKSILFASFYILAGGRYRSTLAICWHWKGMACWRSIQDQRDLTIQLPSSQRHLMWDEQSSWQWTC
jgi:hypothetical protein